MSGPPAPRRLTLSRYILRRNGVPVGAPGSLGNMLRRSLGASSFAGFWRYWNPVFGYLLGAYVFSPLKRFLPRAAALLATFVVCGAFHDLVTLGVRGRTAFLFTFWFFFLGVGVLLGNAARMDLSGRTWPVRAAVHVIYVVVCLGLAIAVQRGLGSTALHGLGPA